MRFIPGRNDTFDWLALSDPGNATLDQAKNACAYHELLSALLSLPPPTHEIQRPCFECRSQSRNPPDNQVHLAIIRGVDSLQEAEKISSPYFACNLSLI